jgi:hypothetical protein
MFALLRTLVKRLFQLHNPFASKKAEPQGDNMLGEDIGQLFDGLALRQHHRL